MFHIYVETQFKYRINVQLVLTVAYHFENKKLGKCRLNNENYMEIE